MSHEISEIDRQEGRSQAWHGLTVIKEHIDLSTCWLAQWDVKAVVLGIVNALGAFIPGMFSMLVATDNEAISIGKPFAPDSYRVLSNRAFLAIVQDTLNQIRGAIVESVGSVCKRGRIFVSLQLPDMRSFMVAGREFKPYLNFLSSHDKSCPFTLVLSTVCTVCNNTFNMNLSAADGRGFRVRVKHTSGMAEALANVPEIVAAYFVSVQRFQDVMAMLAQVPVSVADARAFFAGFLTETFDNESADLLAKELEELSSRRANQIDRLTELFQTGKGNGGQNLADLFSAITDYYSHENSGGDDAFKQVASSEFGDGHAMKGLAWAILQDDKRTANTVAAGHKVLTLLPKA